MQVHAGALFQAVRHLGDGLHDVLGQLGAVAVAVHGDAVHLRQGLGGVLYHVGQGVEVHFQHGGLAHFGHGLGLFLDALGLGHRLGADGFGLRQALGPDAGRLLFAGIFLRLGLDLQGLGLLLLLIFLGLGLALTLVQFGVSLLLAGKALGLGLLLHLGVQGLLHHLGLFLLQQNLFLLLGDVGVGGGDFDGFALLLLLDAVGGVGLGLFGVAGFLQLGLADGQFVLFLGDLLGRGHLGVVGLLLGHGAGLGDLLLAFRAGDGGVFLDLHNVVHAQVLDDGAVVHEILHVEADDVQAHGGQVGLGVLLHQGGEFLPVGHHLLQLHFAHDLAHVALQHLAGHAGDVIHLAVQKVLRRQGQQLGRVADLHVDGRVHLDVDIVCRGHGAGCFYVDGDELQAQFVFLLKEGHLHARLADEHLGGFAHAGDDVCGVRGRLDVARHQDDDQQDRHHGGNDDDCHEKTSSFHDCGIKRRGACTLSARTAHSGTLKQRLFVFWRPAGRGLIWRPSQLPWPRPAGR